MNTSIQKATPVAEMRVADGVEAVVQRFTTLPPEKEWTSFALSQQEAMKYDMFAPETEVYRC